MKITSNFYCEPAKVLSSFEGNTPAAVLVVAVDDHGNVTVYGSHSSPICMMLAKSAIPAILSLDTAQEVQA